MMYVHVCAHVYVCVLRVCMCVCACICVVFELTEELPMDMRLYPAPFRMKQICFKVSSKASCLGTSGLALLTL